MNLTQYRVDFFFGFVGAGIYNIGAVLFLQFILAKIDTVAGWDVYDMIFLHGVGQFWAYLYFFITFPNTDNFNDLVSEGEMDSILLKPMDSMFLATIRKVDFLSLIALLQPIAIISYPLFKKDYDITISTVFLAAVLTFGTIVISHLIEVMLSSIAFWTIRSELGRMFTRTAQVASYPYEIFRSRIAKIFFFAIAPYAVIINVPFRALINKLDYRLILLEVVLLMFFFILSRFVWNQGLKKYQSVSS